MNEAEFLQWISRIRALRSGGEDGDAEEDSDPDDCIKDLVAAFRVFDRDRNGYITKDELRSAMDMIGESVTDQQINELLTIADVDRDGKINYEVEFSLKNLEDNDVEVEVHYCGLNFADLYTRLGLFPKEEKPFVLGIECSGIVKAIGKNVKEFKVGDRVACYDYHGGLHRSTVILPHTQCYLIPGTISLKTAAAAFVAFLTAHCSLFESGCLQPGHQVLVQSCAGAVGSAAVQLARTVPQVTTWGTTSDPGKVPPGLVDHVLTHDTYLEEIPHGTLDLIMDNQACRGYMENIKLLKPFGRIVVTGANYMIQDSVLHFSSHDTEFPLRQLMMDSISLAGLHLGQVAKRAPERLATALQHVWDLLASGRVLARVDSVWTFDTPGVRSATRLLQERQNRAKVLIKTQHADIEEAF